MKLVRSTLLTAARWAARSVWWPLAGKAFVVAVAFAALAYVGTGAAVRLNDGPALAVARVGPRSLVATASTALTATAKKKKRGSRKKSSSAPSASCRPVGSAAAAPSLKAWTDDGKLILNHADVADLRKLPRIGAKRAQAIVTLRSKLGRFKRVRDILRIRGIGYRLLQKLKPLVVLDAPREKKRAPKQKAPRDKNKS